MRARSANSYLEQRCIGCSKDDIAVALQSGHESSLSSSAYRCFDQRHIQTEGRSGLTLHCRECQATVGNSTKQIVGVGGDGRVLALREFSDAISADGFNVYTSKYVVPLRWNDRRSA